MSVSSLFALIVGMFIIYNSFSIAVTQRRTEIGILRALGATQRQVRRLFILESIVAGFTGSMLGVLVGIGVAVGVSTHRGESTAEVVGVTPRGEGLEIE